jgi:hypothetical protein
VSDARIDPSLGLGRGGPGRRYPSPFFDLSQQYMPPTIKELFKWVYFFTTSNSFLGPAIGKIARYPITDLILEDENQKVVDFWQTLLNNTLSIKTFNMETNLDLVSYGNAFVTLHYPFARFLQCGQCKNRVPWKAAKKKIEQLTFRMECPKCGTTGKASIVDVPYKSIENLRLLRINPEFIDIKYNEASGRHTYLYSIPEKLKKQIMAGDPDILEDTPAVYFDAIKQKRKIRLSAQNLFHLKTPTLAGKDMGWGMPRIAAALKDLYYFYTLRRGQEAIINEHLTPLDVIFPQANAKADPFVHTNLASWRDDIQRQLSRKRQDPNYKAIVPMPIGHERIGGDGKALMLTPEMDFLAKTIVGACGIPQEFVYGGSMQWSGSSISLRTLENDFMHHRSQLLQMNIWLIERLRLYLGLSAPKSIRFTDFKMADDVQKLNLMISMASNNKMPWEEVQKEMGRDPVVLRKKLEEEAQFASKLETAQLVRQAEAQSKAQAVQQRYQMRQAAEAASTTVPGEGQGAPQQVGPAAIDEQTLQIEMYARKISAMQPEEQQAALGRLTEMSPDLGQAVAQAISALGSAKQAPAAQEEGGGGKAPQAKGGGKPKAGGKVVNMRPMPQQKPPRRQGGI